MNGNLSARNAMAAPPRKRSKQTREGQPHALSRRAGRIVVAEDNYLVGLAIEQALLDAGHEVAAVVASGVEAVSEASRLRPNLVLMDIRLAGQMTGIEAAVELQALGIPCLFASAHSDTATRISGERAMPLGWLTKPFSAAELTSAVAAALAQSCQP